MRKRIPALLLLCASLFLFTACGARPPEVPDAEPEIEEMRAICELSVSECYYHNVAKYFEEDAGGILWWQKDKRFWIEYSGVVKLGIDASLVTMDVSGDEVTITMPAAKVLSCQVDDKDLSKESYIVDKSSVKVKAEDEIRAFNDAQKQLEETAAGDTSLLLGAQERAKSLLEDYVKNIGSVTGRDYTVRWIYVDDSGVPLENQTPAAPAEDSSQQ